MFEGLLINALILLASLLVLDKASHLAITNSVKVVRKRLDELQKMVSKKPRAWTR